MVGTLRADIGGGDDGVDAGQRPAPPSRRCARMRPCATGLRRIAAWSRPARARSSTKVPRPRRKRRSSIRSIGLPMRTLRVLMRLTAPGLAVGGARVEHRLDDRDIAGAAAEIARQHLADALLVGIGLLAEQRMRGGEERPACRSRIAARDACGTRPAAASSSPSALFRPSTVTTFAPSACTASIRHERTAAPSTITVQAPHTPCSQPTCVPVSRSTWRRQSASVRRGSTSTSTGLPLTSKRTVMRPPYAAARAQRALDQHFDERAAIVGAGVKILGRIDRSAAAARGGEDRRLVDAAAVRGRLGGGEPVRRASTRRSRRYAHRGASAALRDRRTARCRRARNRRAGARIPRSPSAAPRARAADAAR